MKVLHRIVTTCIERSFGLTISDYVQGDIWIGDDGCSWLSTVPETAHCPVYGSFWDQEENMAKANCIFQESEAMSHGPSWSIMVHHGPSWSIMIHRFILHYYSCRWKRTHNSKFALQEVLWQFLPAYRHSHSQVQMFTASIFHARQRGLISNGLWICYHFITLEILWIFVDAGRDWVYRPQFWMLMTQKRNIHLRVWGLMMTDASLWDGEACCCCCRPWNLVDVAIQHNRSDLPG